MNIRIALADDHPLMLDALENLCRLEEGFRVVGRARDGREALAIVKALRPDVLVLDLRMPVMDGVAVIRAIAGEKLPTRVVVLAGEINDREALACLRHGVAGVILKDMAPQLLVRCIRRFMRVRPG